VLDTMRQVSMLQYVKKTKKSLLVTGTPVFNDNGELTLIVLNERDMTELNAVREQIELSRMVTEKYKDELLEMNLLELKRQDVVSESSQMREVLRVALKLARIGASNILILGESGTGKGLLAKFIHKNKDDAKDPFISINCAALPESLLEAELFGYEKGAFTGASDQGKAGLFELAQGGSLFLDEIGDLPLSVQAKLLKYLDDQKIMRLGSTKTTKIDCTIMAATNRDLERLVEQKLFRQDLFYRLETFTIKIPALRERPEDVFELINHFLAKYNREYGLKRRISQAGLEALLAYPFPGNVRELKNILKRAVVMSESDLLDETVIRSQSSCVKRCEASTFNGKSGQSFSEKILSLERNLLQEAMARCRSTREMAAFLATSQPTVVRKMKKHGLSVSMIHK
jgi:transcriptional regulator with PAS, ATPase and Fis domain